MNHIHSAMGIQFMGPDPKHSGRCNLVRHFERDAKSLIVVSYFDLHLTVWLRILECVVEQVSQSKSDQDWVQIGENRIRTTTFANAITLLCWAVVAS